MKRRIPILFGLLLAGVFALEPDTVWAQGTGVSRPSPVETAPLPPPAGSSSGGGVTLTQEPPAASGTPPNPSAAPPRADGGASSALPAPTARPTLVPNPGDPLEVAEVTLPSKAAAVLSGASTWDEGFDDLKNAFTTLDGELGKAGLRPAGRPITVFLETDDMGFRYDAMVPIERIPESRPALTPEIRFGRTPEGKAYHFLHRGPYENIDSTYETITAYLDSKGIIAKDVFIEEYVTDLTDAVDDSTEINIFVQPR